VKVLSEDVRCLQNELAKEQLARDEIEKNCKDKLKQMKDKLLKEKKLRTESNAAIDMLTNKVKELERKYQDELWHYKILMDKQASETYRHKTSFDHVMHIIITI